MARLAFFNSSSVILPASVSVASADIVSLGACRGYSETMVFLRAPQRTTVDGLPLAQRDWTAATALTVIGVNVQPFTTRESRSGDVRAVSTQLLVITRPPFDVDIRVGDRGLWRSRTLEVVAEPQKWSTLTGGVHHVEAVLEDAPPWPGTGGDTTDGHLTDRAQGAATGAGWRP